MPCQTIMPESDRYFIIEVNNIPGFAYSVIELEKELRSLFEQEALGADIAELHCYEWDKGFATALWLCNTKKAVFDAIDYAYPEWTIFKEATKVGSFRIQIDGRA